MAKYASREYLPNNDWAFAGGYTSSNPLSDLSFSIWAGAEALGDGWVCFTDFGISLHEFHCMGVSSRLTLGDVSESSQ